MLAPKLILAEQVLNHLISNLHVLLRVIIDSCSNTSGSPVSSRLEVVDLVFVILENSIEAPDDWCVTDVRVLSIVLDVIHTVYQTIEPSNGFAQPDSLDSICLIMKSLSFDEFLSQFDDFSLQRNHHMERKAIRLQPKDLPVKLGVRFDKASVEVPNLNNCL